jgi:hypothetical protein
MLSSQEEQIVRRRVFAQDQSLPNQASTFHQHALADAQTPRGRFSAVDAATVVGSKPEVACAYPAASAHQRDPCGQEPPLGFSVEAMPEHETLEQFSSFLPAQGNSGDAAVAPSTTPSPGLMSEHAASPPLSRTYRRF